eukprot:GHVQ01004914.1.p1 GENE.GHVQ01004914.1~~GHVQ01004914.1.p1  ORF type:complete len:399 (+),score=56.88 GHVQ01004914.1:396-1592(+)
MMRCNVQSTKWLLPPRNCLPTAEELLIFGDQRNATGIKSTRRRQSYAPVLIAKINTENDICSDANHTQETGSSCPSSEVISASKSATHFTNNIEVASPHRSDETSTVKFDDGSYHSIATTTSTPAPAKHLRCSRHDLAKKWFDEFNTRIFKNYLPSNPILKWRHGMVSTAGICYMKKLPCLCDGELPCDAVLSEQAWRTVTQFNTKKRKHECQKKTGIKKEKKSQSAGRQIEGDTDSSKDGEEEDGRSSRGTFNARRDNKKLGLFRYPDGYWARLEIRLSVELLDTEYRLCETLLHEMCHAAQFRFEESAGAKGLPKMDDLETICTTWTAMKNQEQHDPSNRNLNTACKGTAGTYQRNAFSDKRPHGPAFWKYAKVAALVYPMLDVSTCHSYRKKQSS